MARDKDFEIEWTVEDGFAGGRRPQYTAVDVDILDDEMADDELEELYNEIIIEEFMQNISGYGTNLDEFKEWATAALKARKEEDGE